MLHVADVQATLDWYRAIRFELIRCNEADRQLDWALMCLGSNQLMLNAGGKMRSEPRRDVDLYVETDSVAAIRRNIEGKAQLVEDIHDTFYGMREFTIRDLNGFWITFGEPSFPTRENLRSTTQPLRRPRHKE